VSDGEMPVWPAPKFDRQSDAIAAAILDSEPGDAVIIHAEGCGMARDEDCDCRTYVITVPEIVVQ
jgi:hypothetical protein